MWCEKRMGKGNGGTNLVGIIIAVALLMVTLGVLFGPFTSSVSALPDTHTWDGGGADAFAGTHANWVSNIAPEAGDSIIFNAGALPCTWNLSIALASFTVTSGYTGTITPNVDFGTSGVFTPSIAGSTFVAGPYNYTIGGNWDSSGGTFTAGTSTLRFNSSGAQSLKGGSTVAGLIGNIDIPNGATVSLVGTGFFYLGSNSLHPIISGANGAVLYIPVSKTLWIWPSDAPGQPFSGSGTVTGGAATNIRVNSTPAYTTIFSATGWTFQVSLIFNAAIGYSTTTQLGSDIVTTKGISTLGEANGNITLDTNGYNISATSWSWYWLNSATHTVMLRDSIITLTGSGYGWNTSEVSIIANTSTVVLAGTGIIHTREETGFHNLEIDGAFRAYSSINVSDNLMIGTGGALTQNGWNVNISGSNSTPLMGYGTFDGNLYLNGSTASSYQVQTGLPMGNLYSDRDTKINIDSTRYLRAVPSTTEFIPISIKSIGTESGYAARWTADSTGPVTYTVTVGPNQLYDIWVDHTTRIGAYQTGPDGLLQFTYNGPFSAHEFTVSKSAGPSSDISASFEYRIDGNMVSFTDKSYGGVVLWVWNFGDGYGSTQRNPSHKYMTSGTYLVGLTVYDSEGRRSSAQTNIEIVLGPDNPIERGKQGWNVYVTNNLTISISAIGLIIFGAVMFISAIFLPAIPVVTPKARKLLGAILFLFGVGYFVFIDNSWWGNG